MNFLKNKRGEDIDVFVYSKGNVALTGVVNTVDSQLIQANEDSTFTIQWSDATESATMTLSQGATIGISGAASVTVLTGAIHKM